MYVLFNLLYNIVLYFIVTYYIYICINIILIFPCTHLEITSTLRHHWACCQLPKVRRRYSEILLVHEFLSGQDFMPPKLVWNDPKKCLVKSWPIGWQWSHRFDAAFVADMISDLMISHVGYADKLPAFPPKAFQSWSLLFGESLPVQHLGLWQWPVTETLLTFSWQLRYVWVGLDGFALRRVSAFQEFLSSIIVLCRYREAIGMWTWEDTRDDSEAISTILRTISYSNRSNPRAPKQFQPSRIAPKQFGAPKTRFPHTVVPWGIFGSFCLDKMWWLNPGFSSCLEWNDLLQ